MQQPTKVKIDYDINLNNAEFKRVIDDIIKDNELISIEEELISIEEEIQRRLSMHINTTKATPSSTSSPCSSDDEKEKLEFFNSANDSVATPVNLLNNPRQLKNDTAVRHRPIIAFHRQEYFEKDAG